MGQLKIRFSEQIDTPGYRRLDTPRNLDKTILTEISQCTAVLYSDWSLQMGQMGPKMTLGTLKMNGNDFPGV